MSSSTKQNRPRCQGSFGRSSPQARYTMPWNVHNLGQTRQVCKPHNAHFISLGTILIDELPAAGNLRHRAARSEALWKDSPLATLPLMLLRPLLVLGALEPKCPGRDGPPYLSNHWTLCIAECRCFWTNMLGSLTAARWAVYLRGCFVEGKYSTKNNVAITFWRQAGTRDRAS